MTSALLIPSITVVALLFVRRLSAELRIAKLITVALTALLMFPIWDRVMRLGEMLPVQSEPDKGIERLVGAEIPFDRIVALRTEAALREDDQSGLSALPLITTTDLNIRSGPSSRANVIRTLPTGSVVVKFGRRQGEWMPIEHNGRKGWVCSRFVAIRFSEPIDSVLWKERPYVTVKKTLVFRSPGSTGQALRLLPAGTRVSLEERLGTWIKGSVAGRQGWIMAKDIRIVKPTEVQPNWYLAARLFVSDTFPQDKASDRIAEYLLQVTFWIALALLRRPTRSLWAALASNRIPVLFALNIAMPALWFGIKNRSQLLLMSDSERLALAAVAVTFTTVTWMLVDTLASWTKFVVTDIERLPGEPTYLRTDTWHRETRSSSRTSPINIYPSSRQAIQLSRSAGSLRADSTAFGSLRSPLAANCKRAS